MLPHLMSYTMLTHNHYAEFGRHAKSARPSRTNKPTRARRIRALTYR